MTTYVNLANYHPINVLNEDGETILVIPAGTSTARITTKLSPRSHTDDGITHIVEYGDVNDLPDYDPYSDVVYVVSMPVAVHLCAMAATGLVDPRTDIATVGPNVQHVDGNGRTVIVGCVGLYLVAM